MNIGARDIISTLARTPGLLQELAKDYQAVKFEPKHRLAAFNARALALVTREKNTCVPPYPAGSDNRRHWVDGWNWYLRGVSRAEAPQAFWQGRDAVQTAKIKGIAVTLREDY